MQKPMSVRAENQIDTVTVNGSSRGMPHLPTTSTSGSHCIGDNARSLTADNIHVVSSPFVHCTLTTVQAIISCGGTVDED